MRLCFFLISIVFAGLAELTTALQTAEGESDEVNKLLQNITTLAGEIKADLMGHPTHIGQGEASLSAF